MAQCSPEELPPSAPDLPTDGESLGGFLEVRVQRGHGVAGEVDDFGVAHLVIGVWSFEGTGPDGEAVRLAARNADVLRRQADGTWRFVIDNPWGTD
jgi:ketosteroid isomerase-like protein